MASRESVTILRAPSLSAKSLLARVWELTQYGDLFLTLSGHRIRVRYKQSILGISWAVVQPLALMGIYTLVFSVFSRMPSQGMPYALFVFAAILPWIYFSNAVTNCANSFVTNQNLVTKVFFPREILPLTYIVAALFEMSVGLAIFFIMAAVWHVPIAPSAFWIIPLTACITVMTAGLSFVLAALQVQFRDIGHALPLIMQIGMFACPVVYPMSSVPARFRGLYSLNPLAVFIEAFRRALLERKAPENPELLVQAIAISVVILLIGYIVLKQQELTMVDAI